MDKPAVAGIEVSADVLILALGNGQLRSQSFPTPLWATSRCFVFCANTQRRFASAWNQPASMASMPP